MADTKLMPLPKQQYFTVLGFPLVGGKVYTYAAGGTTPKVTYTDAAGTTPQSNPIILNARGEPASPIFWSGNYRVDVRDALGNLIYSVDNYNTDPGGIGNILATLASGTGSTLIGFLQAGLGAVLRTVASKLSDVVSVKDFGAVGDGVTDDTAAITAAMAHAVLKKRSIYFPNGDYKYTATLNIPYGVRVYGESEFRTRLLYYGDSNAVYMGGPGNSTIISYCMMDDMTVYCFSRSPNVNGINLDNCCYFSINRVSVFGSGSPNSSVPAEQVLYGSGITASNNSIIGHLNKVTTRLWARGRYYWTRNTSESAWTAAIVDGGQGECSNNSLAYQIGDVAVAFGTAQGLAIRDICLQGNYAGGIWNMSGESVTIDSCYFESNASYDVRIGGGAGNPIMNRVVNCVSNGPDIGPTAYGTLPYVYKIHVLEGSFALILNNDLSITTSIPLIEVDVATQDTTIENNRLNSLIDPQLRIKDQSTTTHTRNNFPEVPRYFAGSFIRTLTGATAVINYGGCGFRPTEVEFFGGINGSNEAIEGSAGIGLGLLQKGMTTDSSNNKFNNPYAIRVIRGAGNEQQGTVTGFTSDGFTISWVLVGAPPGNDLVVNFIARR